VLDDPLVWLALAVLEVFHCARVRSSVVAGFEVRAVALDVAGGAAAAGGGEAYVGGHCGCDNVCWGCEWREEGLGDGRGCQVVCELRLRRGVGSVMGVDFCM